ncbi:MAG: hypothetical protein J5803_04545 [Desulfovibrio sp.]|nr:hypothetical protein [Desulfovibrio sp.]
MQSVKRFFFASIALCLLACMIHVPNAQAQNLIITLINQSNSPVNFAFARENGYNPSDNTTKGWFSCQPRSSRVIKIFTYNPNDNYYWFAKTPKKIITKGNDFMGWILPKKAFASERGRKIGGGQRVGFQVLHEKNGKCKITIK